MTNPQPANRLADSVQELLHLGFRRHECIPALDKWVDGYWSVQCQPRSHVTETMYPDGGTSLIFDFSPKSQGISIYASHTLRRHQFKHQTDLLGVRFSPAGLFVLLDVSPADIGEQGMDAQEIPGLSDLHERLHHTHITQRLLILESFLLRRLQQHQSMQSVASSLLVRHCCDLLRSNVLPVSRLLAGQGIQRRRLERLFNLQMGISPNEFRQLQRIKLARYLIKHNPEARLADIAQACGYFDQAHFIHHFTSGVGSTPGEYRDRQRERLASQQMRLIIR